MTQPERTAAFFAAAELDAEHAGLLSTKITELVGVLADAPDGPWHARLILAIAASEGWLEEAFGQADIERLRAAALQATCENKPEWMRERDRAAAARRREERRSPVPGTNNQTA